MQQPDLFNQQPKPARAQRRARPPRDYRKEAELWRQKYPSVYSLLKSFALQMAGRRRKFGLKALVERVRWEYHWRHDEDPKINNSHTSYIARMLIEDCPQLAEFIELREVRF